jgi:hypothetical protein
MKTAVLRVVASCMVFVVLAGCVEPVPDAGGGGGRESSADATLRSYEQGREAGYREARMKYDRVEVILGYRDDFRTVDVPAGEVTSFKVEVPAFQGNLTSEVVMTYRLLQYAGPRFDVFFTGTQGVEDIRAGRELFQQVDGCSDWVTSSISRSCVPPAGTWFLVVDNTVLGGAVPEPDQYGDPTLRLRVTWDLRSTRAYDPYLDRGRDA